MAPRRKKAQEQQQEITKTKINRKHFLDALSKVKPSVASREISDQANYFIFSDGNIWADNDELCISHKFDAGFTGGIKAQEFYDLIAKLPFDEIFIEQKENKILITDGERFEADIKTVEIKRQQGANPPESDDKQWMKLPDNFSKAAKFCVFSASKNMTKPELTCIWFVDGADESFAISCDGYHGTMFELDGKIEKDFLLPASVARHMSAYNPIKYIANENWLHFITDDNTTLSCRVIGDEYPEQVWDFFDVSGNKVKLPAGISDVIKRTETLVTAEFDQDRAIEMRFNKNQITCIGSGPLGKVTEKVETEYDGDKLSIKVHPALLSDILKQVTPEMEIGERLKFETDEFTHCICLFDEGTDDE